MNILILAAGQPDFDVQDGAYPLCLAEIDGKPLIERLIGACAAVEGARFVVALRDQEIGRYHLDNVIELLAPGASILRVPESTCGAACTALLGVGHIDNDDELLILNGNEILDIDFVAVLADFRARKLDAGVLTFSSVHPRYSYVRLDEEGMVTEAAEKNPISRHATVGFYWFAQGRRFVEAVKTMIRKDAAVNGVFYICPSLNQLILEQARIGTRMISADQYHPLKTERQLGQFETTLDSRKNA